jgi:glyoxylase-like metal-dependent hydrolase (beta-lactamase superfamily II)
VGTKPLWIVALCAFISWPVNGQDAKSVLDNAAKNMGTVKSIQYSGNGSSYSVGQSIHPNNAWPKAFNLKSYTRVINYDTMSSREESVRTPAANPSGPESRQVALVSGSSAWNVAGNNANPAPATLEERLLQIWVTPHGVIKAAQRDHATVKTQKVGGKKVSVVSFVAHGKFKVNAAINDQNLVEKVDTWLANPVLGDMLIETTYSDYRDFSGIKFPGKIVQKQGGFPAFELTVTEVRANPSVQIDVPANVRQATTPPVRAEAQKIADGVWYLTGGSHHSVAVEMKDHVIVVEGPQNEERSLAVIAEIKKTIPNKPIKYLVNTHHHFDHSGGIRTYAAEGARIVTHKVNVPFYKKASSASRALAPDKLAQSNKKPAFQGIGDKHVFTDGTKTLEIHHIKGSTHNDGILLAYLPKEKLLIEVDVFTPAAANAPPPSPPNPFSVNLYDNVQRLKLQVDRIVPLHGRIVPFSELTKAIGKG